MKIKVEDPQKVIEALRLLDTAALYPTDSPVVKVNCQKGMVRLAAKSSGCQVVCKIKGESDQGAEGTVVVDRLTLSKLHLWGKAISIGVEKDHLLVSSGRSRYDIPGIKGGKVELEKIEADGSANIAAGTILETVRAVWFGHDDGGTGDIRLILGSGMIKAETADVFRAALHVRQVPAWKKLAPYTITLSRKVAETVFGAFDKDTPISLQLKNGHALVVSPTATVLVPCVMATTMPQVEKHLASLSKQITSTASCTIVLEDVKNSIKGALAVVTEKKKEKDDIAMVFSITNDGLTAKVSGDRGKYATKIRASEIQGEGVFSTSPRYLKAMISLAAREKCDVHLDVLGKKVVTLSLEDKNVFSKYAFVQVRP